MTLSLAGLRTGDAVARTATGDGVTVPGGECGAGLVHATSPAMTSATRLSERLAQLRAAGGLCWLCGGEATRLSERLVRLRDRRPTNKIPAASVDPEGTLELLIW